MRRAFLLATALAVLTGGQALAHARLLHAEPRVGATVRGSPPEILLTFSERLDASGCQVSLSGPGGAVALGPASLDPGNPRVLRAPVAAPLAPGSYRVKWRATSVDTHETEGDFGFKVAD